MHIQNDSLVIRSESLLNNALTTFLMLNDGGDKDDRNDEYYRGGFELLVDTMLSGDHEQKTEFLNTLLLGHPDWKGGESALPD